MCSNTSGANDASARSSASSLLISCCAAQAPVGLDLPKFALHCVPSLDNLNAHGICFLHLFNFFVRKWASPCKGVHPATRTVMCHRFGTKADTTTRNTTSTRTKYAAQSLKHIVRDKTNRIRSVWSECACLMEPGTLRAQMSHSVSSSHFLPSAPERRTVVSSGRCCFCRSPAECLRRPNIPVGLVGPVLPFRFHAKRLKRPDVPVGVIRSLSDVRSLKKKRSELKLRKI